jgi:4-amino-4-deoxy-L-arabinose transferase-like glycosyltransferase
MRVLAAQRAWIVPAVWALVGVAITLSLRLPFLDAAVGRDEGGDLMVAEAWHHHAGPFLYGPYFLDRPPLLVELYHFADTVQGVRILGAIASVGAVVIVTALAVRLGGRRAAPFAAVIAGVSMSAFAAMAVYTPAELLAIVPASLSILLLVIGLQRERGDSLWLFAGAGLAAATALLIKQSFGDALVAGVVGLAVARAGWRALTGYAAGAAVAGAALAAWALAVHASAHQLWYAIVGFRIDATHALTHGHAENRLDRLAHPALASGLAVALVLSVAGIAPLRTRRGVRPALLAWLIAGVAGVTLGGSYWPHYVIQLMPVAAVGAAALLSRRLAPGAIGLCAIAIPALVATLGVAVKDQGDSYQHDAVTVGRYVHLRAGPGQTAYVQYARVNALYYTGLRSPFPYHWSLMLQAIPHMGEKVRAMLRSAERPTWIIAWDRADSFGLGGGGATARLLHQHYRPVARVCGQPILLERGARAKPPPPMTGSCEISRSVLPRAAYHAHRREALRLLGNISRPVAAT